MTMQRVVGLDLSLTATGIAVITRRANTTLTANTSVIVSTGKRTDTYDQRDQRQTDLTNRILSAAANPTLVLIEGLAFRTKDPGTIDRIGLFWRVYTALRTQNVPTVVIPPATRSTWATGAGNADKAAITHAAARLWPDWQPTTVRWVNDEGDALALATIAAQHLGWVTPTLKRHTTALDKVAWPQGVLDHREAS